MRMKNKVKYMATLLGLCLVVVGVDAKVFADTKSEATMSNTTAPQGGTFNWVISSEPEMLHPIKATDLYASYVQGFAIEGLMNVNLETYEENPGIAERYELSKDGMTYTFYLRKDVKFHNGQPVTAEDVKWSYEALMDDRFGAFHVRAYLENIKSVEVVDKYTVKFNIAKKYFGNLRGIIGIIGIIPKSVYGDPDNKKANKLLVGTGPYMLDEYKKGQYIRLKRNPNWWGRKSNSAALKGTHNFDYVKFRFVKDENVRLEMLKKAETDWLELTPEQYVKKAVGSIWGKKVLKKAVQNKAPVSYGYIGWNLKDPKFQDKQVRQALAHLMNRELMNEKFRYNRSYLATGPWYKQSPYADPKVKPFDFDPKKARELLKKAGWTDSDKDGVLDKVINGTKTPFKFTLMFANRDSEKYHTIYRQDLKKAGIQMDLKVIEWNSLLKALDEKRFDAVNLGWGGGSVHNNPKQIWHSDSMKKGGSNYISYSNPKVDKLIDQGLEILDNDKRKPLWQEIYRTIADDAPYVFMFNDKFAHYGITSRMGQEKDTYTYGVGPDHWWVKK